MQKATASVRRDMSSQATLAKHSPSAIVAVASVVEQDDVDRVRNRGMCQGDKLQFPSASVDVVECTHSEDATLASSFWPGEGPVFEPAVPGTTVSRKLSPCRRSRRF